MRETDENNHGGMRVLKTDVKEKGQQKCGSKKEKKKKRHKVICCVCVCVFAGIENINV